jgi:hypothetical protein
MTRQLHDTGEEYYQDKLSGESFDIALFADEPGNTGNNLSDGDDLSDITTEPVNTSTNPDVQYERQTAVFSSSKVNGDWVLTNDSDVVFDVGGSANSGKGNVATVDSYAIIVNFDSDDAGDNGTPADHLLATGELSQTYALGNLDKLTLSAGGIGTSLS